MKPPALCFHSVWEAAAATSKQLTAGCANVFYTVAIDSRVDDIHDLPQFWNHDPQQPQLHCNIAFVNRGSVLAQHQQQPQQQQQKSVDHFEYRNWTVVLVDEFFPITAATSSNNSSSATSSSSTAAAVFSDPRKPTRVPKLSPSRFFAASARYAVYMDSKLRITCDPRQFIEMMSADDKDSSIDSSSSGGGGLALLAVRISQHNEGVYTHIDHVLERTAERPSITYYPEELRHQRSIYEGFGKLLGVKYLNIFDGAFMVHDLRSEAAKRFRCDWYREYQQWSDRDQVAAAYVLTMRALAMHSNATNWRNNFIPIGIDVSSSDDSSSSSGDSDHSIKSDYLSFAYSREELNHHPYDSSSNDRERYNYYQGNVRFVRLLPGYEYHWTKNPGKIGVEDDLPWSREDDNRGVIPPELQIRISGLLQRKNNWMRREHAMHDRVKLMKQQLSHERHAAAYRERILLGLLLVLLLGTAVFGSSWTGGFRNFLRRWSLQP